MKPFEELISLKTYLEISEEFENFMLCYLKSDKDLNTFINEYEDIPKKLKSVLDNNDELKKLSLEEQMFVLFTILKKSLCSTESENNLVNSFIEHGIPLFNALTTSIPTPDFTDIEEEQL